MALETVLTLPNPGAPTQLLAPGSGSSTTPILAGFG